MRGEGLRAVPKRRFRVPTRSDSTYAVAENSFATGEKERIEGAGRHTRAVARRAIFDFIEIGYNDPRRRSCLGYRTPAEFEQMAAIARTA